MRAFLTVLVVSVTAVWFQPVPGPVAADEPKKDDTQSELKKLQGLWETSPGGAVHRDGKQVVYQPGIDGPCFFVHGDRLIWLEKEGKPSGEELTIKLEVTADPKRITFTPVGDGKGKKPIHGIYAVTGPSLRLHIGLDGGPAPQERAARKPRSRAAIRGKRSRSR